MEQQRGVRAAESLPWTGSSSGTVELYGGPLDFDPSAFPDFPIVDNLPTEQYNPPGPYLMPEFTSSTQFRASTSQQPLPEAPPMAPHIQYYPQSYLSKGPIPVASGLPIKNYAPAQPYIPKPTILPSSRFYQFLNQSSDSPPGLAPTAPMAFWGVVSRRMISCNDAFLALFDLRFPDVPSFNYQWDSFGFPPPPNLDEESAQDLRDSMESLRSLMNEVAAARVEFARGDFLLATAASRLKLMNITVLLLGGELMWVFQEPRGMAITVAAAEPRSGSFSVPAAVSTAPVPAATGIPPAVVSGMVPQVTSTVVPAVSASAASTSVSMPPPASGERRTSVTRISVQPRPAPPTPAMPATLPDESLLVARRGSLDSAVLAHNAMLEHMAARRQSWEPSPSPVSAPAETSAAAKPPQERKLVEVTSSRVKRKPWDKAVMKFSLLVHQPKKRNRSSSFSS